MSIRKTMNFTHLLTDKMFHIYTPFLNHFTRSIIEIQLPRSNNPDKHANQKFIFNIYHRVAKFNGKMCVSFMLSERVKHIYTYKWKNWIFSCPSSSTKPIFLFIRSTDNRCLFAVTSKPRLCSGMVYTNFHNRTNWDI